MHTRVPSFTPPQLDEHSSLAVVSLSPKQAGALYKKSQQSGFSFDLLERVYRRGLTAWVDADTHLSETEFAFNRVNSFVSGGRAAIEDVDLLEDAPCDREEGTTTLADTYRRATPGQCIRVIKSIIRSKPR